MFTRFARRDVDSEKIRLEGGTFLERIMVLNAGRHWMSFVLDKT